MRPTPGLVRFCDYRDMAFANACGAHVQDRRLTGHPVFVVDRQNVVRYVEYLPEVTSHPNYNAALRAHKQVFGLIINPTELGLTTRFVVNSHPQPNRVQDDPFSLHPHLPDQHDEPAPGHLE